MEYRLELKNVSKSFGEVQALDNINFQLGRNEVVGLLGDNGAGKSTLIKIITGYHQPSSGEIFFNGRKVDHLTVPKARELGVETVYQERALAELQTLWRNIFLGRELCTSLGFLDIQRMRDETHRLMTQSMGFTSHAVSPDSRVGKYSGGEKQGVAIVRALFFDAEIIVLDEPTMGLSLKESAKLVNFVTGIKQAGQIRHLYRPQYFSCLQCRRPCGGDRPRQGCRWFSDQKYQSKRPNGQDGPCCRNRQARVTNEQGCME